MYGGGRCTPAVMIVIEAAKTGKTPQATPAEQTYIETRNALHAVNLQGVDGYNRVAFLSVQ